MRWPAELIEQLTARGWMIDHTREDGRAVEVDAHRGDISLRARRLSGSKGAVFRLPGTVEHEAIAGTATVRRDGMGALLRSMWWDAPRPVLPLMFLILPVFVMMVAPIFLVIYLVRGRRGVSGPWPRDTSVVADDADTAAVAVPRSLLDAIVRSRFLGTIELRDGRALLEPQLGTTGRGVSRTLGAIEAVAEALVIR